MVFIELVDNGMLMMNTGNDKFYLYCVTSKST
jgi:hypothetical protein